MTGFIENDSCINEIIARYDDILVSVIYSDPGGDTGYCGGIRVEDKECICKRDILAVRVGNCYVPPSSVDIRNIERYNQSD